MTSPTPAAGHVVLPAGKPPERPLGAPNGGVNGDLHSLAPPSMPLSSSRRSLKARDLTDHSHERADAPRSTTLSASTVKASQATAQRGAQSMSRTSSTASRQSLFDKSLPTTPARECLAPHDNISLVGAGARTASPPLYPDPSLRPPTDQPTPAVSSNWPAGAPGFLSPPSTLLIGAPAGVCLFLALKQLGVPTSFALPILAAAPVVLSLHQGKQLSVPQAILVWAVACFGVLLSQGLGTCIAVAIVTFPSVFNYVAAAMDPPPPVKEPYPPPETQSSAVAWVNDALRALFPLISSEVLTPAIDLIEDALIGTVPPIISSVRLSDVSLGSEPVLLTSLRAMSTQEWHEAMSTVPSPLGRPPPTPSPMVAPNFVTTPGVASAPPKAYKLSKHKRNTSAASKLSRADDPTPSHSRAGSDHEDPDALAKRDLLVREIRGQKRGTLEYRTATAGRIINDEAADAEHSGTDGVFGEEGGQYVNYEIGFVYRHSADARARGLGLHAIANFGAGIKNVGGIEFPIFVDLIELRGKAMVRLLLASTPPFLRDATFSFASMPEFEVSARPLRSIGFGSINAFDIPLLKGYLHKSIAQVAEAFIRPKSYTVDIDRILVGGESSNRTTAIGVFYIYIHAAHNLRKSDAVGLSDPYLTVSYSKFNRPVYSTRTIVKDLNPVWEEPCFVLVQEEALMSGEKLRLRICDSDRIGSDDVVGLVELDVADLVEQSTRTPGTDLFFRRDDLAPERPGMKAQGTLDWSVRMFPVWKMPVEEVKRRVPELAELRGEKPLVPPWWLDWLNKWIEKPDWTKEKAKRRDQLLDKYTAARHREEVEAATKPSMDMPAGILHFHIHQADHLEIENLSGTWSGSAMSRRKSAASGKPALSDVLDRAPYETPDPPSPYVEVLLNSKIVYRTRTEQCTPLPYFNAVSERFIRDWRQATIAFAVRDYRPREHAPLLGVVYLRLKDVFKTRSQVTHWYPIVGGVGWGRLRVSLLFKSIDIPLPRGVSANDVSTLQITHMAATDAFGGVQPTVIIETEYDKAKLAPGEEHVARELSPANSLSPAGGSTPAKRMSVVSMSKLDVAPEIAWQITRPLRLAVMYRHSCSVVFTFASRRVVRKKVMALATLRLDDCADGEEVTRKLPIFETSSIRDAMHAAQVFHAAQNGTIPFSAPSDVRLIGYLTVSIILHPGFSRAHRRLVKTDGKIRSAYETWEATRALDFGPSGEVKLASPESEVDEGEDDERDTSDESSVSDSDDGNDVGRAARNQLHNDDTQAILQERGAHGKALRKTNRGIFNFKIARTANFAFDKAKERILTTSGKTDIVRRPHGADMDVEREGENVLK